MRALNATKLERVFAKPFLGNLDGHRDGVFCFANNPTNLSELTSGAYDGEIRLWNLQDLKCQRNFIGHNGFVRGITYTPDGNNFISVGDDKAVKTWKTNVSEDEEIEPTYTFLSRTSLSGISHHKSEPLFATCGEVCQLWETGRSEPLNILKWGVDNLNSISFNPIESSIIASCASDRSIILYDKRNTQPIRKVVMTMRCNSLSWNPMEAFVFTVANEDYNSYTFDTRHLKNPLKIHKGHVSAVLDVKYSPTGKEFVTGSYDKTIRLYEAVKSNSREVYHNKRMQHVTCVGWSLDNKYVYSGSDEMNIRLWKAVAHEKLGAVILFIFNLNSILNFSFFF